MGQDTEPAYIIKPWNDVHDAVLDAHCVPDKTSIAISLIAYDHAGNCTKPTEGSATNIILKRRQLPADDGKVNAFQPPHAAAKTLSPSAFTSASPSYHLQVPFAPRARLQLMEAQRGSRKAR